jgi:hypothetical protein
VELTQQQIGLAMEFLGSDVVNVGGLQVSDQAILFVTNQTDNWAQDAFDGILGLGFCWISVIFSDGSFDLR